MSEKPTRVVQVTIEAHEGNGGVFTSVQHFSRALNQWCESSVVDFTSRHTLKNSSATVRISTSVAGRKFGWIDRSEQKRLGTLLSGADFIIIHVPYRFHAGFVAEWCRRNQVPYAFVPHGALDPYVFTYRAWQKKLWLAMVGRRLVADASFVIFATRGEAEKAERLLPRLRSMVLAWPTALPTLSDRRKARQNLNYQFNLPAENRILLFLGRLHPMKRPLETAEAFRATAPSDWTLVIAGPEEGVSKEQLHNDERVRVLGPIFGAPKEQLLMAADALVLYSHRENFGFAVTEALARATPVLISQELDLAKEITALGAGWVADAHTASGRQQGMIELMRASPADRLHRGERGRAWVAHELSEERFATSLREKIESAIRSRKEEFVC